MTNQSPEKVNFKDQFKDLFKDRAEPKLSTFKF